MTVQHTTSAPGVRPGPPPPDAQPRARPSADDARALAADSSTFAPAMALLPNPIRADVSCLYRVLRTLDDLVNENDPRALERVQAVERWALGAQAEADLPQPDTPETRALAGLAARHPLARGSLVEFCEGMRHDIARESIETDGDFMRYCQRAGGSVGVVLATILGTRNPEGETRMAVLGRAMQVTNILRDIDEDLTHGRVYISRAAIERFGNPSPGAREELMRDHIARADALYEEGLKAIPLLREGRRAMALAGALYREILREIEREGYGSRPGRVVVAPWRRHLLAIRMRLSTQREGAV